VDVLSRPIVPPAPKVHARDLPFWRLLLEMGRSTIGIWPEHAFDDLTSSHRQLGIASILVNDPAGVRHVLSMAAANYQRPVTFLRITRPVAGDGLLVSEGEEWRTQRRTLAPAFTPATVGTLLPHFMAAAETMARRLEKSAHANLSGVFHDTALDAVLRALFSTPVSEERASFASLVRRYVDGPARPTPFDGFAKFENDFAFSTGSRRRFAKDRAVAVQSLIKARREAGNAGQPDLLDLLIAAKAPETGQGLSDVEIADQCATIMFAGFETTSRLIFWATYLLSLDIGEQARLHREVRAFPPERISSLDDLQNWPRLRQTLLETLRLYPPAPNMVREAIGEDVIAGVKVEPRTQVWISPWVIHRHRKFWDQPTAFIPDRFAGAASPWTSNAAFIPFGGGPRICIGASFAMAEAQIILATLISRFEFSLPSDRSIIPVGSITTAPDHEPNFALRSLE
jgi:cytochrome P450